jgi:acetyl-CoA decarbonylase/synthase complex subunit delta
MAVQWEFYTGLAAAVAGAEIICVRHPRTIKMLNLAFASIRNGSASIAVR